MGRICLYFKRAPESDRWVTGDRFVRPLLRRMLRDTPRPGGVDKVFLNLCLGLDRLGISYQVNRPFKFLEPRDRVGVIGRAPNVLEGYDLPNRIVAGPYLMTHPSEWGSLCDDYPVVTYLQHSDWANAVYKPYFGERCQIWPVGIDTETWTPAEHELKSHDFLIYDKIRWQRDRMVPDLLDPVRAELERRGLNYTILRYGDYDEAQYLRELRQSRFMLFLCEHESQGLAYQEALATDVPLLAWDQGWCLDPNRFGWGQPHIPATSVPYFDRRCGLTFRGIDQFSQKLTEFFDLSVSGTFAPRSYVTERLSLEICSARFLDFLEKAQFAPRSRAEAHSAA